MQTLSQYIYGMNTVKIFSKNVTKNSLNYFCCACSSFPEKSGTNFINSFWPSDLIEVEEGQKNLIVSL